jgi:Protein of unknown function (DUF2946)
MNRALHGILIQVGHCCRRMVAVLAVYTIVLHGFAFSVATASIAAATDRSQVILFETCQHDRGVGPKSPEAPGTGYGEHCVLCLVAGAHTLIAPELTPLGLKFVSDVIAWQLSNNWRPLPFTAYCRAQPRGPPLLS